MFDKKMIFNNVFFGFILANIWLYDYHYKLRYSKKISKQSLQIYRELSADFQKVKKTDVKYKYNDVYYITLVNFKNVDETIYGQIEQKIKQIYQNNFKNVHDYKVYFRHRKIKIGANKNLFNQLPSNYSRSHQHSDNFYFIYLTKEFYDKKLEKKDNVIHIKLSKEKLTDENFQKDFLYKSIFYLKKMNQLNKRNFQELFKKYEQNLQNRFVKYVKSLLYINSNKNLAFFQNYLEQIEIEANYYREWFKQKNYKKIYEGLEKEYLYIYQSHYMYEDYYFAMMIASVLLMLSPVMRIATAEARNFIFDLLDLGKSTEKEGISYVIEKVFNFLLDN